MDGKARVERQIVSGVRDRVVFLDRLRTKHGFDAVMCLTPKVETRLRAGDQPAINLKLEYISVENEVALTLSVGKEYPREVVVATLQDLSKSEVDRITEERTQKLTVIHDYLQFYLMKVAEESKQNGGECFSHDTNPDTMAGLQVIEKFNQALTNLNCTGTISLSSTGEIQKGIFQFGTIHSKLDRMTDAPDSRESEEGESGESDESPNLGTHKVTELVAEKKTEKEINTQKEVAYKCKKCRHRLFLASALDSHENVRPSGMGCTSLFLKEEHATSNFEGSSTNTVTSGLVLLDDTGTSHSGNSGKVACDKCGFRVGSWSWLGLPCSCKAWVCPAFQIVASKVDESK